MPRGDKTGPEGKGPLTGRGLGDCEDEGSSKKKRPKRPIGRRENQRGRLGFGNGMGPRYGSEGEGDSN
jgi:hypothetical protein